MKKITVTILAIALVAIGAIFVIGQTTTEKSVDGKSRMGKHGKHGKRDGKRGGMRGNGFGKMFKGLDLTDAQKTQIKEIQKASHDANKSLHDQMRQNQQQLRQLSESGTFDEAAVTTLANQQGQLHAQMIVARQKTMTQMFNILTPEQKTKFAELKAQFKQKMEERKAKWAEMKEKKTSQE